MNISITIPGKPIGKARPRFFKRGNFVGTYSAQKTEEGQCMLEICKALGENFKPLTGPLKLEIDFFMPRPKSHFGTGRNVDKLKESAPTYPTTKPDISNCIKFYEDCLNGLAWVDDKQICEIHARRIYSAVPETDIFISKII